VAVAGVIGEKKVVGLDALEVSWDGMVNGDPCGESEGKEPEVGSEEYMLDEVAPRPGETVVMEGTMSGAKLVAEVLRDILLCDIEPDLETAVGVMGIWPVLAA
jgi:hypothetical protein